MGRKLFFECCCTTVREVVEAICGGASRIELCEALEIGGVTPSESLIREALEANPAGRQIPINVLVRPRGGNFVYSKDEADLMVDRIGLCKQFGVNGIVVGALDGQGNVDMPLMRRLMAKAAPLEVTFHRAFDECRAPEEALEDIIALGCRRLLSSGHEKSADEGRELLSKLVRQAGGRIIVMPGAGITPDNIARIVQSTQATEYHGSAHGPAGTTDRAVVSKIINCCQPGN